MWTPCMLREDIVDDDVPCGGLIKLLSGELFSFCTPFVLIKHVV
jgi:hypothetical protein